MPSKFTYFTLIFVNFVSWPITLVVSLLLVDIGQTYGVNIGVSGQLQTISSGIAVISALLIGGLSTRYRNENLLKIGLVIILISIIGCAFAVNFSMIFIMYGFAGIGIALVGPMSRALVGNLYPIEERTRALAWLTTGVTFSYIIGAPIIGFLAEMGDWRTPFLFFCLPILLIAIAMAFGGLPETRVISNENSSFFSDYTGIFYERSAVACLLATILTSMAWQSIGFYSTSFYREVFDIPANVAATFITIGSLCTTLGIQASGWFVSKYGRKTVSVVMGLVSGLCIIGFLLMQSLIVSLFIRFVAGIFGGVAWNSVASLTLEQGAEQKGLIMSLYSASMNLGLAFGSAIGGLMIILFGYEFMGVFLGLMQIISVIIIFQFTTD